ncbi:MAG: GAF domain-containing protein [Thermoleophilaceae bacterium]|nr:GAF domain-containing protein [Thermoleophilaceae bacterium]
MVTSGLAESRLFEFSRQLQSVQNYEELLVALSDEVRDAIGYNSSWISIVMPERGTFKTMTPRGTMVGDIWDDAVELPIAGDEFVTEVVESRRPVIIEDAQSDPRVNREVVEALGLRTIVTVPLTLIDTTFGTVSTGTFGDEGVRLPSDAELEYLGELAKIVVLASARILLAREREEKIRNQAETDRLLADRQRIESLGELAGGVAHDFNNMITVILGAAQVLRGELKEPEQFANLRLIENAAESASDLAKQLLAIGKRQELSAEPTDVVDRVRSIGGMLGRVLGASITVEVVTEPDLPEVFVDRRQLEQVLMNLGLNARDAMPDGGTLTISVESDEIDEEYVETHPWSRPGKYVRITVADDGVGMSEDTLQHIFDPFFTTRTDTGGTGLGLSVTRAIIEQHGGLVRASSKLGSGTAVSVYLPALPVG